MNDPDLPPSGRALLVPASSAGNLFDEVAATLGRKWKARSVPRHGRSYRCRCGRPIFFRNSECLACGAPLGYEPLLGEVRALEPGETAGGWRLARPAADARGGGSAPAGALATEPAAEYRRCSNYEMAAGCNWLVSADDPQPRCRACRLNRFIPNQSDEENRRYWHSIEVAKRRLVSQLIMLGLPVRSKLGEDPERGLAFDFLRELPGAPPVVTGHAGGLVTLNAEEADDAKRERIRHALREPYRTLLGHLRHEVGHYYWDRLIAGTRWHEPCRALFGDERADYAAALRANYERGPRPDWARQHISAYASVHPWEDWAETWAHYLHAIDSLDTALGFGLDADDVEAETDPFGPDDLYEPAHPQGARFLAVLNAWVELTTVLNELSHSMGQPDFYPFVMSRPVVRKLHFVHLVVQSARG